MVDTRDLKSLGQKCPCGFDSRLRHKRTALAVPLVLLPLSPTLASRQNCSRKPYRKDTGGTPYAILSGLFHRTPLGKTLLQENEKDGEHKADERRDVVPVESLAFEEEGDNQSEDDEGDNLLDNF